MAIRNSKIGGVDWGNESPSFQDMNDTNNELAKALFRANANGAVVGQLVDGLNRLNSANTSVTLDLKNVIYKNSGLTSNSSQSGGVYDFTNLFPGFDSMLAQEIHNGSDNPYWYVCYLKTDGNYSMGFVDLTASNITYVEDLVFGSSDLPQKISSTPAFNSPRYVLSYYNNKYVLGVWYEGSNSWGSSNADDAIIDFSVSVFDTSGKLFSDAVNVDTKFASSNYNGREDIHVGSGKTIFGHGDLDVCYAYATYELYSIYRDSSPYTDNGYTGYAKITIDLSAGTIGSSTVTTLDDRESFNTYGGDVFTFDDKFYLYSAIDGRGTNDDESAELKLYVLDVNTGSISQLEFINESRNGDANVTHSLSKTPYFFWFRQNYRDHDFTDRSRNIYLYGPNGRIYKLFYEDDNSTPTEDYTVKYVYEGAEIRTVVSNSSTTFVDRIDYVKYDKSTGSASTMTDLNFSGYNYVLNIAGEPYPINITSTQLMIYDKIQSVVDYNDSNIFIDDSTEELLGYSQFTVPSRWNKTKDLLSTEVVLNPGSGTEEVLNLNEWGEVSNEINEIDIRLSSKGLLTSPSFGYYVILSY